MAGVGCDHLQLVPMQRWCSNRLSVTEARNNLCHSPQPLRRASCRSVPEAKATEQECWRCNGTAAQSGRGRGRRRRNHAAQQRHQPTSSPSPSPIAHDFDACITAVAHAGRAGRGLHFAGNRSCSVSEYVSEASARLRAPLM